MSSPATSPSVPSKLPRFLQKQTRDRPKSETPPPSSPGESKSRKSSSRFLKSNVDDPPIIVEPPSQPQPMPIPSPRARTRSDHPAASAPETQHLQSLYASTSSTGHAPARIGDLPTRLSGWFAHTFSSSSTDLSLPTILAQHRPPTPYDPSSSTSSPRKLALTGPAALLAAAKHGRGTIDKAMRYLLDSDAVPDRCSDPIWLMGVQHPGWEAPPPLPDPAPPPNKDDNKKRVKDTVARRGRAGSWRSSSSSAASSSADGHSSPASSAGYPSPSASPHSKSKAPDPGAAWPPAFYADFTSRVWLTYRSHLPSPIRDTRLADLDPCSPEYMLHYAGSAASSQLGHDGGSKSPTTTRKTWPWAGEKTWSADTGWGCMLRTGQSLLANALIFVALGRDWRRPPHPVATPEYATYVRILTWFLDTPAPQAPFSVHRMALAGKELGTDVGQWFGPSVAAGAIKTLVSSFPECGLAVAVASDGVLYQSQVFAASHGEASREPRKTRTSTWGERPVLLLLGIRLGIEGVNPIYYDSIKMLYTFPQSIGIAGGRPSSSYYFVGAQAGNLFYLDPHNPRPAIPLRPAPTMHMPAPTHTSSQSHHRGREGETDREKEERRREKEKHRHGHSHQQRTSARGSTSSAEDTERRRSPHRQGTTTTSASGRAQARSPPPPSSPLGAGAGGGGGSTTSFSQQQHHLPSAPSPLQQQFSQSSASSAGASSISYAHERSGAGHHGRIHGQSHGRGRASSSSVVGYTESESGESGFEGRRRDGDRKSWEGSERGVSMRDRESRDLGSSEGAIALVEEEEDGGRAPPPAYNQHRMHRVAGVGGDPKSSASRSSAPHGGMHSPSTSTASTSASSASASPSTSAPPPLDPVQLHYINAYSAAELQTFHCERVRKMPVGGLDPSMLIGFVCRNEAEWVDLRRRVSELPKTIFSIQDEPPTWPSDMDDNMGLESISEPDDVDCLLDADDDSPPRSDSQDLEGDEDEQFFDTRSGSSVSRNRDQERRRRRRRSTDTSEEDPADPVTPGPTSRFEIRGRGERGERAGGKGLTFGEEEEEFGVDEEDEEEGEGEGEGDIEDDWIDPLVPSPISASSPPPPPPPPPQQQQQQPPPVPVKDRTASSSSASSSRRSAASSGSGKTKRQKPVPVPSVRIPEAQQQQQQQQHYPFPVAPAEEPGYGHGSGERTRSTSGRKTQHRMHNARARDGGRTQSGGVKGILTDERGGA